MRFKWFICLITVVSLIILAGCSNKTSESTADGKTQIEFWHYFSQQQAKPLEDAVKEFEKANPDVRVKTVFMGNPGQLKQRLDGSFAAGSGGNPTVSLVYESWVDDFLARGYMDPLQKYMDGPDGLPEAEQEDFVRAFREGNMWDGKYITLPFNKSIYMLYMNMDMLKQAGLTTAPATQDDLGKAAVALTARQGSRISTYGWGVMPKGEAFTTLLLARGGNLLDEAGKPVLNSPQALDVMNFLKGLQFPEKHLLVSMDYMSVALGNKLIAMYIYSSASLPYNKQQSEGKFAYAAAPIPGIAGAEPRYLMQGTNIGIFANRPEKERKAAWELIKFLIQPDHAATFLTRSGYMPYRYSLLQQPLMQKHMAENPDYALGANLVLTDKGTQEPKRKEWEGVRSEIDKAVDQLLSRPDSNPQALLDELQKKAEQRLK